MANQTLPYLACLKGLVSNLAAAAKADPGAAVQAAIAGRLLEHMIVQYSEVPKLKAGCYETLKALLPEIEALLGESAPAASQSVSAAPDVESIAHVDAIASALLELRSICASGDIDRFDRFLELVGTVGHALLGLDDPRAAALCKAVAHIEADYGRQIQTAVDAHVAAAAQAGQGASAARNTRSYDEQALLAFIRKAYSDETELGIEQSGYISGGSSKFTVGITLKNAKSLPARIILRGDAAATYGGASVTDEHRLIKILYEHGVCVAKPLALEESGSVFGSAFLLAEHRPGACIGHMFNLPQSDKVLCADIAAKLAGIHRVPPAAFGRGIDGVDAPSSKKALAWIEEGYNNWRSANMPSAVLATAWEWLRRHAGINDKMPRALVHGDYGLNNILVADSKVSAILDWEFAHIGNPGYDLGYFYFMAEALSSWEEFLDAYGKAGMPLPDEEQLDYATLFAATRLGTMVCQTAGLFASGAEPGIAGAAVVGGNYYEETLKRITGVLDRVL